MIETKVVGEADPEQQPIVTAGDVNADLPPTEASLVKGRLIMDYGDSGDGKSTRAHSFARYHYIKSGLKVRVIASEDASKQVFQDLIDAGIVEFTFIPPMSPLPYYERLMEGEWPVEGEFDEYTQKIGGKDVVKKKQRWQKRSEWDGAVSAYIVEGLSTISENILDYLRETGRFPREQSDSFADDGRTFMAASQTAFGFTQSEGQKLLKLSGALPVERVLWTSHEAKGKDEMDGSVVRGPKLVGSAATNTVRKLVGVLLHTDRVDGQIRCYFENHPDQLAPKVTWKAKVTTSPILAKEFKAKYPQGFFVPSLPNGTYVGAKDGLIPFLELEEVVRSKSGDAAAQLVAQHKESK